MKIKNIINSILFSLIIIGMLVFNIVKEDTEISLTERRKLAQLPKFTKDVVFSTKLSTDFESYAVDQVAFREEFRTLKSFFNVNIFGQKDNNSYFEKDGAIYKMEYPLLETNVDKTLNVIKNVCDKYLSKANIYSAIIPDKNYYLNDDHLTIDYEKLKTLVNDKLTNVEYIDIWNELDLDCYYKTDIHWRQEKINKVAIKIKSSIVKEKQEEVLYNEENVGKFYGTYYGQIACDVTADDMYILTNDMINEAVVYNYETKETLGIYDKRESNDKYDVYLSGATPLIGIKNPNVKNGKELLIFRDSFGSSLAPLLIDEYEDIILIDLRYMSSQILDKFVEFKDNQDVLFIYSTMLLNQNILK